MKKNQKQIKNNNKKNNKIGHSHNNRDSIFGNSSEHNFTEIHQNSFKIIKK